MKITSELDHKITSCVAERYEKELSAVKEETYKVKENIISTLLGIVTKAVEEYPEIKPLILQNQYGSPSIEDAVRHTCESRMFRYDTALIELKKEEDEVLLKKRQEIDAIKIQISYGKTFDDIKTIFESYGFNIF